ncbi:hypothetical protein B5X24_HaOG208395 [Helicoverpa armigera]|uniref:Uncharacterized protein n=1 Tax=Helicoverpa armigera TaxID=29058 RepID=A0A2W1BMC6_HELAM|nr:hypothetical protein B5X24_HaOG208395 [Helicoverpa armigera]
MEYSAQKAFHSTMRILHFIIVILSVVLLASVGQARPPHRSHKQKRASFCMLKICTYMPMAHKVQGLR